MNYSRRPLHPALPRACPPSRSLGAAALIAGCGSSGSSSTITVGNENTRRQRAGQIERRTAPTPTAAKTPTSGPLSQRTDGHAAVRRAADDARDQRPDRGHRARSESRRDRDGQLRGRALQGRQSVRRLLETQRTVHVRARQGPGHRRLGPGHRGHESGRPARADHPRGARLRRQRLADRRSRRTRRSCSWSTCSAPRRPRPTRRLQRLARRCAAAAGCWSSSAALALAVGGCGETSQQQPRGARAASAKTWSRVAARCRASRARPKPRSRPRRPPGRSSSNGLPDARGGPLPAAGSDCDRTRRASSSCRRCSTNSRRPR